MKYIYDKNKFTEIGRTSLPGAGDVALRALLWVSQAGTFDTADIDTLAAVCGTAPSKALAALEEWQELGILTAAESVKRREPLEPSLELHELTGKEVARIIEEKQLASLIDVCQQQSHRVFSTKEVAIIAGLAEEFSLSGEYILMLLAHCINSGKKSLKYLESTAISLIESGIDEPSALEAYISRKEKAAKEEFWLRQLFGIGERALSKNESNAFYRWTQEWNMTRELITLAFEFAVDATQSAPIKYVDKILLNWHTAGVKTVDEATALHEKNRAEKQAAAKPSSKQKRPQNKKEPQSFDVDDFFSKALERSYGKN